MRIIDAHHHVWRRVDLPWLLGPSQPRIFGPYDAIKRDYPIEEFLRDVDGTGVDRSVFVQANVAPNWFEDEVARVARVAAEHGWPHAIVAFCDVTQGDARADLDRLARHDLVRGVRHQMHWHSNPEYRFVAAPDHVARAEVIGNVRALSDYGFVFELQVFAGQVDHALTLVTACPETTFVLQHALMMAGTSGDEWDEWRHALHRLAACPNVVCKLSGLNTFVRRLEADLMATIIGHALAAFGAERCMWGSNFPIEKLWTEYAPLLDVARRAVTDAVGDQADDVFAATAARIYRI